MIRPHYPSPPQVSSYKSFEGMGSVSGARNGQDCRQLQYRQRGTKIDWICRILHIPRDKNSLDGPIHISAKWSCWTLPLHPISFRANHAGSIQFTSQSVGRIYPHRYISSNAHRNQITQQYHPLRGISQAQASHFSLAGNRMPRFCPNPQQTQPQNLSTLGRTCHDWIQKEFKDVSLLPQGNP